MQGILLYQEEKRISNISELVEIIKKSKKRNFNKKINVCTKTFQALRIFVNKETTELIEGLIKATQLIKHGGKIIVISFHSIEDKIVKYYFKNYSSNKSNPSRYVPSVKDKSTLFFEKYQNKFLTPTQKEIKINPPFTLGKVKICNSKKNDFVYPKEFKTRFKRYLDLESINENKKITLVVIIYLIFLVSIPIVKNKTRIIEKIFLVLKIKLLN